MMNRGLSAALTGALTLSLAVSAPASAAEPKLGPYGYGKLKIGQTKAQARKTGLITIKRKDGCTGFDLKAHRTPRDQVGGYISEKYGVVAIFATAKAMRTPRGITLGSTKNQVKKAYPSLHESINVWWVWAPGSKKKTQYWFLFDKKNKVYELGLVSPKQDCFN